MKKETLVVMFLVVGCASGGGRQVLDNSNAGGTLPAWTRSPKVGWEEAGANFFKADFTVHGGQRVNGCYDLAKLDLKESLLAELKQDIAAEVNLANEGIEESADPLITKSIRARLNGTIKGLRVREQVFERYLIGDVERIDCFVQASMTKAEYQKLKASVVRGISSVDSKVVDAVRNRQVDFFGGEE